MADASSEKRQQQGARRFEPLASQERSDRTRLDETDWRDLGGAPVADYFKLDRHLAYKADDEMELEGAHTTLTIRTKDTKAAKEEAGAQLPSPSGSE